MGDTTTTFDGLYKQIYDQPTVYNLLYKNNVFLNLVPKDEGFGGDALKVPIIIEASQGLGHTFSKAQAKAGTSSESTKAFLVTTRAATYKVAQWDRQAMLAAEGREYAFMELQKVIVENAIRSMGNDLAADLYRSGYGDRGNISTTQSSFGGKTLTLDDPNTVYNFAVGMDIVSGATQTGALHALGSSAVPLTITNVDQSNGILTFSSNVNDAATGIPTIAAGDYLFRDGDHTSGSTTAMIGFAGWVPPTPVATGGSDSFWGIDRSVDNRLYGCRKVVIDGSNLEEVLIDGAIQVQTIGGTLDHYFMNPVQMAKLVKSAQSRFVNVNIHDEETGIGCSGIKIYTPAGEINCFADRTCPTTMIAGVQMDTWKLATLGPMAQVVNNDGLSIRAVYNASSFEQRWETYGQLVCMAPGYNINISVPA